MATLSRLTARSVVLSVLLGAHPAWATASELIRLTADFDIKEATLRVPFSRMVSVRDLVRSEDGYRLSDRLLARQRRQDDAINPQLRSWDGTWTTLVITSVGIDARIRAALRTALQQNRFAELREGVWLRPDNVKITLPDEVLSRVRVLHSYDDSPADLAALLWDLPDLGECRRPAPRRHGRRRRRSRPIRRSRRHGASPADRSRAAERVVARRLARCSTAEVLCAIRRRTGGQTKRTRTDGGALTSSPD